MQVGLFFAWRLPRSRGRKPLGVTLVSASLWAGDPESGFCGGEALAGMLDVPGLFLQGFVVPFATGLIRFEEIAAIDVIWCSWRF
jgi:hypothetical protein